MGLGVAMLIGSAGSASALSIADLQAQVRSLLAQIAALQAQQGGQSVPPSAPDVAPASCKVWYDGCNTCTREYAGGPLSCTEVQCIWNAGSSCKEYFAPDSGTSVPAFCQYGTPVLRRGASGSAVSALQEYLQAQGYLSASATGYYGPATEGAVQQWQAQQGLVTSGSAYTTGWGAVGPRTWSYLRRVCTPIVGGDRDAHGCIGSAGYTWCSSLNQCIRSWETTCPVPPTGTFGATPLSGSAPLTVAFTAEGYANSWTNADGSHTAIADRGERYIDSGDGSAALRIVCTNPTGMTCAYQTSHTYATAGTYIARLFTAGYYGMQNDATYGTRSDVASQTITVSGGPVACPAIYQPVCGRQTGCANTCPAGMFCTMMCRLNDPQTYGSACELKAAGAEYLYDGACQSPSANKPPVISGISGPTTLSVNQVGTWSVTASDPENQSLSYQVTWGDEVSYPMAMNASVSSPVNYQTSTFTHSYASAGTYTVSVTVTDAQGRSAQTSTTVQVGGAVPVACTMEYAPVCGQPPEPACRHSFPVCMVPTPGPRTYGNLCQLRAEGAAFLYGGECAGGSVY